MLFNSFAFVIFFPLVTAGYFLLPHRFRWAWLLSASSYFYMAFIPEYILILLFTIIIDYLAGIWIERATDSKRKKWLLTLSIVANVGVLAAFKYYPWLFENMNVVSGWLGIHNPLPFLKYILPIGLSFHTFQAMSYTIEVYRGNQKAEHHFGIYALYVMFYPQLVAGPIERPQNLIHQFHEQHSFDYDRVTSGLKLMAWGMFKKVVVADRMALIADAVFNHPHDHWGWAMVIGILAFTVQIYCDFSGYSDIAIGSAEVMGFKLMKNFDRPYFSTNIAEFWRRWHISLSTWFKDYVYIPLGGNRVGKFRNLFNLFVVFLLSGLWHGADWKFVIWGALHGVYIAVHVLTVPLRELALKSWGFEKIPAGIRRAFGWLETFILVSVAWIFFRANTLDDALYIFKKMWNVRFEKIVSPYFYQKFCEATGLTVYTLWCALGAGIVLLALDTLQQQAPLRPRVARLPFVARWALYYGIVLMIYTFGVFGNSQFIYFQF